MMFANTLQVRAVVHSLGLSRRKTWTDKAKDGSKLVAFEIAEDGDVAVAQVQKEFKKLGYTNRVTTTTSPEGLRYGGVTYLRIKAAPRPFNRFR